MRAPQNKKRGTLYEQKGVALIIVAGLLVMFMSLAALSVDMSHLYAVRNELQNAADAGALAGARRLFLPDGTGINVDANQVAYEAAVANKSDNVAVEVNDHSSNKGDIQRGHWSFTAQTFTPSNNIIIPDLWDVTSAELDSNTTFVNAVRVRTRRESIQANSFFARILGYTGFNVGAEAVAYIGFVGRINPMELGEPIALCKQSILSSGGEYTCSNGRMMNATIDTAAWTNLTQPCQTAGPPTVNPLICNEPGANARQLELGGLMGTTNGTDTSIYQNIWNCWRSRPFLDTDGNGIPDQPWPLTLPVIDCCPPEDPNCNPQIGNCMPLVGAVNVNVLWITEWGEDQVTFPRKMEDWSCPPGNNRQQCWDSFTEAFDIHNFDGTDPILRMKSIYLKPDCGPHDTKGNTGGQNFGILAKIPVLVN